MLPADNIECHRRERSCFDGVTKGKCRLWMNLRGVHPQTGETVDRWGCADEFVPLLLVENAQQARQAGAAVESFRNEVVRSHQEAQAAGERALRVLTGAVEQPKVIEPR